MFHGKFDFRFALLNLNLIYVKFVLKFNIVYTTDRLEEIGNTCQIYS